MRNVIAANIVKTVLVFILISFLLPGAALGAIMFGRTCESSKTVRPPTFCTVRSQAKTLRVEMSLENNPGFLLNFSEREMTGELKHSYLFKSFRLNIAERQLLCNNSPISLTPKAFDMLALLVEQNGHLVEKEELLKQVWADSFVEEANIARIIHTLRKTLGEDQNGNKFIETVATKGYRFVAKVTEDSEQTERPVDKLAKTSSVEEDFSESIEVNESAEPLHGNAVSGPMPQSRITKSDAHSIVNLAEWRNVVEHAETQRDPITLVTNDTALLPMTAELEAKTQQSFSQKIKLGRKMAIAAAAILLVVSAAAGYYFLDRANGPLVFEAGQVTRLTSSGRVKIAAISPDGKFVIYAQGENNEQLSLWIQHIGSESNVQIAPPADIGLRSLDISPDGNWLYYIDRSDTLYRMPVLGGSPKKVAGGLLPILAVEKIGISPDSKQLAYVRKLTDLARALFIADADGANERMIASFETPVKLLQMSEWSPDGKIIACGTQNSGIFSIFAVQIADGTFSPITHQRWEVIRSLRWMPDSKSLMVSGSSGNSNSTFQIWQIPYPDGEARRITNDANIYEKISLTADGGFLAVVKTEPVAQVWATADNDSSARPLTVGFEKYDGTYFLGWMADRKILYDSRISGKKSSWTVESDGSNPRLLIRNVHPSALSPDGRYLVYQNASAENLGLWRTDLIDGTEKRLTKGADIWAAFSPDGKWIVYTGYHERTTILKVPVDGGEPETIYDSFGTNPKVSPDGKTIAFTAASSAGRKIKLISFDGGEIINTFDAKPQRFEGNNKQTLEWTPDGRGVYFIALNNDVSNIWLQPIDGSPPVQITSFETGIIFNFAYSSDGNKLALSRGSMNSDVVLIKNSN